MTGRMREAGELKELMLWLEELGAMCTATSSTLSVANKFKAAVRSPVS